MTKNTYQKLSPQTQEEGLKIAKGIQRPAQSKEQTRLIAQGIQQGIDIYKKQQKEKARALDRKLKKVSNQKLQNTSTADPQVNEVEHIIIYRQHWLPWVLLVITWLAISVKLPQLSSPLLLQ